jgi:hypothetical protein
MNEDIGSTLAGLMKEDIRNVGWVQSGHHLIEMELDLTMTNWSLGVKHQSLPLLCAKSLSTRSWKLFVSD